MKNIQFMKTVPAGSWVMTDHGAIVKIEQIVYNGRPENNIEVWVSFARHIQNVMLRPKNIRGITPPPKKSVAIYNLPIKKTKKVGSLVNPNNRFKWTTDKNGRLIPAKKEPKADEYEVFIGRNGRAYSRKKKT